MGGGGGGCAGFQGSHGDQDSAGRLIQRCQSPLMSNLVRIEAQMLKCVFEPGVASHPGGGAGFICPTRTSFVQARPVVSLIDMSEANFSAGATKPTSLAAFYGNTGFDLVGAFFSRLPTPPPPIEPPGCYSQRLFASMMRRCSRRLCEFLMRAETNTCGKAGLAFMNAERCATERRTWCSGPVWG